MESQIRVRGRGRYIRRRMNQSKYLYMLLILPLIYFVVFKYVPMYGVIIAFKDFKIRGGIMGSQWVGFANFREFLRDPNFKTVFYNTIILSVMQIVLVFPLPIVFALMLNENRSQGVNRFVERVSSFPHFISTVVVISMLTTFVSKDGIVNQAVAFFGGTPKSLMHDSAWFRPLYIITDIWQSVGWSSIIYIAALAAVDLQLYEACEIDGGGRWARLRHVSIPSIVPTITILFIMRMGSIMSVSFEKVLLMQNPTIYAKADVISTYVYRRGLEGAQYSYATAINVFESLIGIAFLLSANFISQKLNETSLF